MTDLLDDKIRSLMAQVVEASPVAEEIEDTMELRLTAEPDTPVVPLLPAKEPPRRRWLVAVASAAAVLLLVGGVALVSEAMRANLPVATTPPDPSSSLTWSRLPHDEAQFGDGFGQWMASVTVGGPGLVAVGQAGSATCCGRAAVWTSPNGITWSRVPHEESVFGGAIMYGVTAGGPGVVAVGTSDRATVWTSPDGFTWSRVPHDDAAFGAAGEEDPFIAMTDVIAGGPGLVAVGIDGHWHGPNPKAAVWTSVDGITWSRVPHDDAVFGRTEDGHYTEMESVTVGGPGLVAVGGDRSGVDGQDGGAAVWTSPDGFTWSRVPHDEVFSGGGMRSVTVGGPGLVAVGGEWSAVDGLEGGAAVWTSVDGITWSRVAHDESVFGGATMNSVTAGGPGLVAVGIDGHENSIGVDLVDAVVWTSPDGITWSRVPHNNAVFGPQEPGQPALEMWSITMTGSHLVAVGANTTKNTAGPVRSDAAVWVAVPGD
jgi:hypothetical protein